ncbi:SNF2 family domain-containing protein [Boletus edulis]|nr:SNF2 family domain-containing protein [Boletus edulis]
MGSTMYLGTLLPLDDHVPNSLTRRVASWTRGSGLQTTTDRTRRRSSTRKYRVFKPFKPPSVLAPTERVQPARKRKRVSYKESQGDENDSDSDDARKKKKKKDKDKDGTFNEEELRAAIKTFPVYKPKPFELTVRRFSMPTMVSKSGEVVPLVPTGASLGIRPQARIIPRPLHDPMEDHAMYDRETDEEKKAREKEEAKERAVKEAREKTVGMYNPHKSLRALLAIPKVPVVIDSTSLQGPFRPHQIEFLYRCTTGMLADNQYGCIMADEMGLGKTLQCIALLWTLIKQSPHAGKPTIEKCIIACPSSLVKNWANELVKWLGKDTISAMAPKRTGKVGRWVEAGGRNVTQPVMIVSYETLRTLSVHLANCSIGLLLCDEGHRLKNSDSLTFQSLNALNVKRRVYINGHPPSRMPLFGARDASSSAKVQAESEKKLKELGGLVTKFIIRRTNDILSKYLPVKYEHVVFCKPSSFQLSLYRLFILSPEIKALLRGADSQPLKAINILKKLCNHPELLNLPEDLRGSEAIIPEGFVGASGGGSGNGGRHGGRRQDAGVRCEWGGKFVVLERFLHQIKTTTNDKIVLISNYTQTLDLFEKLCRSKNSKAGGCGLNLIGANRLILFDPDWNPAADQQALARVWRDGQKKECFVYRFISTGTIEEKIYQRQASKQALSSAVVDEKEDAERHFSLESLRQLFTFNENTTCDTHDTFKCKRCKNGKQVIKSSALLYGDASTWNHFTNAELKGNHDDLLRAEVDLPEVSFVFQYISH